MYPVEKYPVLSVLLDGRSLMAVRQYSVYFADIVVMQFQFQLVMGPLCLTVTHIPLYAYFSCLA
jgi:hypothetical protein